MATTVKRVVGALLALAGLALTVVGVWFAAQLGTSGTAEFTVRLDTADPVLIGPDVLNRVDQDVVVTATPAAGDTVWMALANPSDATAVVGGSEHVAVTGVSVRSWSLLTQTTGTGSAPALGAADLWRQQDDAQGPVSLTVEQSGAPETVVVAAEGGRIDSLNLKVTDKSWFVEAVVAALIGLFLLVAGVVLVTSRHRHHPPVVVPPVPGAADLPDAFEVPEASEVPEGTIDPAEAVDAGDATEPTVPFTRVPAGPLEAADATDTPDQHDPHDPEEVTR
jgi:hypothetical protein